MEMADALNDVLSSKWRNLRGLEIVSFGVSSVKASEEDEAMLKELQRNAAFMDPTRAAAHLVGAQASAMQAAANNQNAGPAMAFMGMNMAGQAGGVNAQSLYQMGAQQQAAPAAAGCFVIIYLILNRKLPSCHPSRLHRSTSVPSGSSRSDLHASSPLSS